jgi:hypothetical protein
MFYLNQSGRTKNTGIPNRICPVASHSADNCCGNKDYREIKRNEKIAIALNAVRNALKSIG